jgi:hypothetical protein
VKSPLMSAGLAGNAKKSKERSSSPWLLRLLFFINVAIQSNTGEVAILYVR